MWWRSDEKESIREGQASLWRQEMWLLGAEEAM
jgi:hypothetical protein